MKTFSFIRNIYLSYYYHITETKKDVGKKADPFLGFIGLTFLVNCFHMMGIIGGLNAIGEGFINDAWRDTFFIFRGSVNLLVVTPVVGAIVMTYFVCCYKLKYEDIEQRLQQTPWLLNHPKTVLIALPVFSMALTIILHVLVY